MPERSYFNIQYHNETIISQSGISRSFFQSDIIERQSVVLDKNKIISYQETSDFWMGYSSFSNIFSDNLPDHSLYFLQDNGQNFFKLQPNDNHDALPEDLPNMIVIYFYFIDVVQYYRRYPDTIVMALTRIGGLLALLRIGIALSWFHEFKFMWELKRLIQKSHQNNNTNKKFRLNETEGSY